MLSLGHAEMSALQATLSPDRVVCRTIKRARCDENRRFKWQLADALLGDEPLKGLIAASQEKNHDRGSRH